MNETKDSSVLTEKIIGAAIDVHRQLGPGLLESVYEECLCIELDNRGLKFDRQKAIGLRYKNRELENKLVLDLLVENNVIVELKAVKKLEAIHEAQLLTYLKLTNNKYGLLINFNVQVLKDGIKRLAN
ncbi:MAG: GxxExxY protein [Gammaproteobacteria bacterium]|nr:MAG: GxxExxY protein [Gammaproteobacteria bacterium]